MFSKTFGYALRSLNYVINHGEDGQNIGLKELAEKLDIPYHFLGKIMQDLARQNLVNSTKGPSGGFRLNEKTRDTKLIDLLKITDGDMVFMSCALGIKQCNASNPCAIHHDFAECRNNLQRIFSQKTVGMLADEHKKGFHPIFDY